MNMPTLPNGTAYPKRVMVCGVDCHQGDAHCNGYCRGAAKFPPSALAETDAGSAPLPGLLPPELLTPLYSWLERQVAKGIALVATITGGIMDADGPGRAFAWFVGVLAFLLEMRASRATEQARKETVAAVQAQQRAIVLAYNMGRRD